MISGWDIYWITRLDSIGYLLGIGGLTLALLGLVIAGITLGMASDACSDEEEWKPFKRFIKRSLGFAVFGAISMIFNTFIPTTKEAAAIYLIPRITANEDVQQIPANAAKLLNGKLQEWIDDLEPTKQ
jgi:hypothetical protein